MEVLETINKVFSFNLRRLRGNRTQSEIADLAGLSLRGYQRLENGTLPRKRSLTARLAEIFGVGETELFLDPDIVDKAAARRPISVDEALFILRRYIETTRHDTDDPKN